MKPTPPPSQLLQAPSLRRRLACLLYESLLCFGVIFFAALVFSAWTDSRHALTNRVPLMAFSFLVLGAYFSFFWHKGQTLAMQTWGIRLVSASGQHLSLLRTFWRYTLAWLWVLPPLAIGQSFGRTSTEILWALLLWFLLWAGLSVCLPGRQFPHDMLAGTRLIKAPLKVGVPARKKP
jgi:uncharacterized RDD family membrane protein YckC